MTPMDLTLRTAWLASLRASRDRAIERECDYAQSEHDADVFDPIGLLAYLASGSNWLSPEAHRYWRTYPGADGAWVPRQQAMALLERVGISREALTGIVALYDAGASWSEVADVVEACCG